ncbi:MAG: hypothetical protein OEX12_03080 [Gammaproteobacteria bacterium]|nr:hypothetical protein [Gammaproteobacteria bacterium]
MTHADLKHQLQQLEEDIWQAILDGSSLYLHDDQSLVLHAGSHPDTIITLANISAHDISALRAHILAHSDTLLDDYYCTHPLTKIGFERQVVALIAQYGAAAFAAVYGSVPERTLFVELGEVIAESADSPRYRYGAYCELEDELLGEALEQFVAGWVSHGEAYELYISMNACRYGCLA